MQIAIPPLLLPPLVPPPSTSQIVNKLLDKAHFHLSKLELKEARRALFEAYRQFQQRDALEEDKKAYFFTMNGYIMQLMAEYN